MKIFCYRNLILILAILIFANQVMAQTAGYLHQMGFSTDFSNATIALEDIQHGGPAKDGIPAIDAPEFISIEDAGFMSDDEPVISFSHGGVARAYSFRVLLWHEIVNDTIGGLPVTVTYCPLCNSAYVFERTLDGNVTTFGTTGWLRHSNLLMYDRTTESWWQQFTGEAVFGQYAGARLKRLPARIESFARFRARYPQGEVLDIPARSRRPYGNTPYQGYDRLTRPWLYDGEMPDGISPMARVVAVDGRAWSMALIARLGELRTDDGLIFSWSAGQTSAMDTSDITKGSEVGNITVWRVGEDGLQPVVYGVDYAFAFHAFYPDAEIVTQVP
jgi:Protein of unknown function (DUF3179)